MSIGLTIFTPRKLRHHQPSERETMRNRRRGVKREQALNFPTKFEEKSMRERETTVKIQRVEQKKQLSNSVSQCGTADQTSIVLAVSPFSEW
uniref:Uncharacterized protein n=1 Tax=Nelumbo nucifera TaxID=4432 RepID=A0A822XS38_NELNU|nr:TPA_asm: hypothetical protein HUJ06_024275 [Nelumbo nucifera]